MASKRLDPWTGTQAEISQLSSICDGVARGLWPTVVQLFTWRDPESRPRPLGSGVLVRNGTKTCIFSAAHVLAEFKNSIIWLRAEQNVVPLPELCECCLTGQPDMGDHQNDKLDAGVLVLPVNGTGLSSQALYISEIKAPERCDGELFMLLGYPANRTEVDSPKKEVRIERMPLIYVEVDAPVYTKAGYDPRTHLLLKWRNQWRSPRGNSRARNLQGSSGGAIWRFNPNTLDNQPQLAATFTELEKYSSGKVLVGTRIEIHVKLVSRLERESGTNPAN